jgi:tRNA(fMet)-specific endonuclease VapC
MSFLLDTNIVIALFNSQNSALRNHLKQYLPKDIYISSIVSHELYFGAYKSARAAQNIAKVDSLPFEVLPFDKEDAQFAGDIRAKLGRQGAPIGPYDVLIAGQAWARDLTLITHNTKEFSRIDGLKIADWLN